MPIPLPIVFFMIATLAVLVTGIVLMGVGGNANKKYSNTLMVLRVTLQAVALISLLVMVVVFKK